MSGLAPPRDSLELGSLASSNHEVDQESSSDDTTSTRRLSFSEDPIGTPRPDTRRSYSVSSAFDFNSTLYPLSTTGGYTSLGQNNLDRSKSLTYLNGLSLVVGLIIGSGIFSSPASVNSNAGSPGASLIVWTVAGLLAWTGAASYAELGGAIPLNGGAQVYLSKIFAEWVGFLFTWSAVMVLKPGSAAIIAIIFGEYVTQAVGIEVSPWLSKIVAILGLALVTFINCASTRLGTKSADVLMVLKFVALLAVSVTGVVVAITGLSASDTLSTEWRHQSWFEGTTTSSSQWAVALYAGLWAYDGWDNTNYVTGEMINPARDLPRTIHTALPVVILSYLLANLSYIFVLPAATINSSNTVAVVFGSTVFGPLGAVLIALVVAGSCLGALNATTFTAGRLVYAAGKEGYLPSIFGMTGVRGKHSKPNRPQHKHSKISQYFADDNGFFDTPILAMALNSVLTTAYIIIGDFTSLTTFYGISSYLFYFLTVVGLITLRIREPELERPYRCWLITPITFCCVSLFLLSRAIFAKPFQALIVLVFLVAGLPLYWWRIGRKASRQGQANTESSWKFWKRWWR